MFARRHVTTFEATSTFTRHAMRRRSGHPTPTVLVGDAAVDAWKAWLPAPFVSCGAMAGFS